jgi:hypothetical protein
MFSLVVWLVLPSTDAIQWEEQTNVLLPESCIYLYV